MTSPCGAPRATDLGRICGRCLDADGNESAFGHLPLRNAFFAPYRIATEGGIEPILRGLAVQMCNEIDVFVVDDIDLLVGGLAENKVRGAMVGQLFRTILVAQFEALRDGDRFWYARTLNRQDRDLVERTRLSDIIRRNTSIGIELPDDVFRVAREDGRRGPAPRRGR